MDIKRAKTGIPGLDTLLYGGIPRRNVALLSGRRHLRLDVKKI